MVQQVAPRHSSGGDRRRRRPRTRDTTRPDTDPYSEHLHRPDTECVSDPNPEHVPHTGTERVSGPGATCPRRADHASSVSGSDAEAIAGHDPQSVSSPDTGRILGPDAEHVPVTDTERVSGPDGRHITDPDTERVSGPDAELDLGATQTSCSYLPDTVSGHHRTCVLGQQDAGLRPWRLMASSRPRPRTLRSTARPPSKTGLEQS